MNNETNRLAQIIANAADKELGTRVITDGQPRRQDKAAALAIEAEYLFIRRDELPKAGYIERPSGTHVEVAGAEAGTWPIRTDGAQRNLRYALEYLAASIAIQEWHEQAEERHLKERREELAGDLAGGLYTQVPASLQAAIDHIIQQQDRILELEGNAA